MARITEDTLTADLSELVAATQEPLQDFTADPSLQNSIITIRTRAERALAEVMGARDAYDTDQTENKVAILRFADTGQVVVEEVSLLRESLETRLLGGPRQPQPVRRRPHRPRRMDLKHLSESPPLVGQSTPQSHPHRPR